MAHVEARLSSEDTRIDALLDSGCDRTVISYRYMLSRGWKPSTQAHPRMTRADGSKIRVYRRLIAPSKITDSRGQVRECDLDVQIVDIAGYNMVLGRDWLMPMNPDVNWADSTWKYRRRRAHRVRLERPERFEKTSRPESIFLLYAAEAEPKEEQQEAGTVKLNGDSVPEVYADFANVFSEAEASILPEGTAEHVIELEPGKQPPRGGIYSCARDELKILWEYLQKMLAEGKIRPSVSPAGAPILFVPKADGTLRLCIDYQGLNAITVKNRYPLPRIDEMMDRLVGAKYFTKLDLRDAYHRIRIRKGDEWKTAFRTRYGHYEYLVMPFGLCNAPPTFQAYINRAISGILDVSCIVYLDDILISSNTEEEHIEHVREVLERLQRFHLYAKLSKCNFHQPEVKFLGFVVRLEGIKLDPSRLATVADWPIPATFHDIQVFRDFTGYFRRFIRNYSELTAPLTDLLKGMKKGRKTGELVMSDKATLRVLRRRSRTLQCYST